MSETVEQRELSPAEDIRAALNSAFETQEPAAVVEKPATERPDAASVEKTETPVERARGPDGKFIRAEGDEAPETQETPETTPEKPEAEAPETKPEPAASKEAPANWNEADKATFKALPPQAQEFLLKRHTEMTADYTRKTQEIAAYRREFEPIAQMFAPYQDVMRQKGLTIASAVNAWYNVERQLQTQGPAAVEAIAGIVRNYRIPTDQLAVALGIRAGAPAQDGTLPPIEGAPSAQLPPEIIQRLSAVESFAVQQQQAQQFAAQQAYQSAAAQVQNEIDNFAAAVDSAGQPLHPYFREVEAQIERLVLAARTQGGPIPPLSELYDQAVYANPSTRAQLLATQRAADEAQRAAAEEKRQADARAKAERSRRAGASVSGAPGSNSQAPARPRSNGSVRDDILAASEEMADA